MYGIHVKFNDEHIPESPFKVNISPDGGSARQVTVHALKDRGLSVRLPLPHPLSPPTHVDYLHMFVRILRLQNFRHIFDLIVF